MIASFVAITTGISINSAQAQNAGYAPPPMFEDMTPPMVRPESPDGYLVRPKTSSPSDIAPMPTMRPSVPARPAPTQIAPQTPAPHNIPGISQPPVQMMQPIIEPERPHPVRREKPATAPVPPSKPVAPSEPPRTAPIRTTQPSAPAPRSPDVLAPEPAIAPLPAPSPVPSPAAVPSPKTPETPAAPIPQADIPPPPAADHPITTPAQPAPPVESMIKGPKTMPSLPVDDVDEHVIFDAPQTQDEPTILERMQPAKQSPAPVAPADSVPPHTPVEKSVTPIVPAPKKDVTPATFDNGGQNGLKKIIPYEPGQIGLPAAETDAIAAGVVQELDAEGKKAWRVQIKSFATPHGAGISSDRRLALSRALSLRSSLIAQGVAASCIDVLAEGLQTDNTGPADRIDLYLYGPKE